MEKVPPCPNSDTNSHTHWYPYGDVIQGKAPITGAMTSPIAIPAPIRLSGFFSILPFLLE
jgi:hypothetical protein